MGRSVGFTGDGAREGSSRYSIAELRARLKGSGLGKSER